MIDFEMTEEMKNSQKMTREFVEKTFRPIARKYDENEHQIAEELQFMASMRQTTRRTKSEKSEVKEVTDDKIGRGIMSMMSTEEIAWGDLGLMLANPGNGLGNAAIAAVATDEQFERFGGRYAAMAITEPGSGSAR